MAKGDSTHTKRVINFGPADPGGNRMKMVWGKITATGNYATGGYSLDLRGEIPDLQGVQVENKAGYVSQYSYTTRRVLVYYGDNNNVSDGPLIVVPDNANIITAYTDVVFFAWGF